MKKCGLILSLTATYLLAQISYAYAYLDPGTGSLLLQGLIGAVATALTFASLYWQKVKSYFTRQESDNRENKPNDAHRR